MKKKKRRTWGNEGWERILKDKDDTCNWQEIKKPERIPQVKIVREQTISIQNRQFYWPNTASSPSSTLVSTFAKRTE